MKNGKILRREQIEPKGEPSNPLTDVELNDKFLGLVKMVKGNEDLGTKLSDDLINLEKQESIKNLMLSLKVQDMPPTLAVV